MDTSVPGASPADIAAKVRRLAAHYRKPRDERRVGDDANLSSHPYPGLRSFDPRESDLFFGRETHARELGGRLKTINAVLVLGGSGSGKSSLVKAGLLPRLRTIAPVPNRAGGWYVAESRPRTDPTAEIVDALWNGVCAPRFDDPAWRAALAKTFEVDNADRLSVDDLRKTLRRKFDDLVTIAETAGATPTLDPYGVYGFANGMLDRFDDVFLEGVRAGRPNLLLVIDQFEEIFDEQIDPRAKDAVLALVDLARRNPGQGLFVVLTMRSEHHHRCAEDTRLVDFANQSSFLLELIDDRDVDEAVTGPAHKILRDWGLVERKPTPISRPFAPDLLDTLKREFNQLRDNLTHKPDSLPLLQHTLEALWDGALRRWDKQAAADPDGPHDLLITREDFHAVTSAAGGASLDAAALEPFRLCLKLRADACLAAAKEILRAKRTTLSDEEAERILVAPFTALAHRDERRNWTRTFATTVDMLAICGPAAAAGLQPGDLDEALTPFVDRGYLVRDPRVVSTKAGDVACYEYNVCHEALIRSWPTLHDWMAASENLSISLGNLDATLDQAEARPSANTRGFKDRIDEALAPALWAVRWALATRERWAARLVGRNLQTTLQGVVGGTATYAPRWGKDRLAEHQAEKRRFKQGEPKEPDFDAGHDAAERFTRIEATVAESRAGRSWALIRPTVTILILFFIGLHIYRKEQIKTELETAKANRQSIIASAQTRITEILLLAARIDPFRENELGDFNLHQTLTAIRDISGNKVDEITPRTYHLAAPIVDQAARVNARLAYGFFAKGASSPENSVKALCTAAPAGQDAEREGAPIVFDRDGTPRGYGPYSESALLQSDQTQAGPSSNLVLGWGPIRQASDGAWTSARYSPGNPLINPAGVVCSSPDGSLLMLWDRNQLPTLVAPRWFGSGDQKGWSAVGERLGVGEKMRRDRYDQLLARQSELALLPAPELSRNVEFFSRGQIRGFRIGMAPESFEISMALGLNEPAETGPQALDFADCGGEQGSEPNRKHRICPLRIPAGAAGDMAQPFEIKVTYESQLNGLTDRSGPMVQRVEVYSKDGLGADSPDVPRFVQPKHVSDRIAKAALAADGRLVLRDVSDRYWTYAFGWERLRERLWDADATGKLKKVAEGRLDFGGLEKTISPICKVSKCYEWNDRRSGQ